MGGIAGGNSARRAFGGDDVLVQLTPGERGRQRPAVLVRHQRLLRGQLEVAPDKISHSQQGRDLVGRVVTTGANVAGPERATGARTLQ